MHKVRDTRKFGCEECDFAACDIEKGRHGRSIEPLYSIVDKRSMVCKVPYASLETNWAISDLPTLAMSMIFVNFLVFGATSELTSRVQSTKESINYGCERRDTNGGARTVYDILEKMFGARTMPIWPCVYLYLHLTSGLMSWIKLKIPSLSNNPVRSIERPLHTAAGPREHGAPQSARVQLRQVRLQHRLQVRDEH